MERKSSSISHYLTHFCVQYVSSPELHPSRKESSSFVVEYIFSLTLMEIEDEVHLYG